MKYKLHKKYTELDKYFYIRQKYVDYCQPKNKKELVLYENYSNILINIYYFGNIYSKNTQENLKKTLNYKNKNLIQCIFNFIKKNIL